MSDPTAARFSSIKTFRNLPCSHRQWRHGGHCAYIHGYSRAYTFHFAAHDLDENHFVVDFGSLKRLGRWLDEWFDHTCLINADDPELETFRALHDKGIVDLRVLPNVSMEASARFCWQFADHLVREATGGRAWCWMVESRENDKNAGTYIVARDGTEPAPTWVEPDRLGRAQPL